MSTIRQRSPNPSADEQQTLSGTDHGPPSPHKPLPYAVALPLSAGMGLVFGALYEKSHVYEPMAIRGQFNFEKWIMMKMFMGAVAGSCGSFAILSAAAPAKFAAVRAGFHPVQRGIVTGGVCGGGLLGAGMAIAGACPGMVLPQVGTGLDNSLVTTAGGLCGALAFGLLEPTIRPLLAKGAQCTGDADDYIDVKLDKPFALLCVPLGVACGGLALLLEILVPFQGELLGSGTDPGDTGAFPNNR